MEGIIEIPEAIWYSSNEQPARPKNPVNLSHRIVEMHDVFQDVTCVHQAERPSGERQTGDIGNDVHAGALTKVRVHEAADWIPSAPEVHLRRRSRVLGVSHARAAQAPTLPTSFMYCASSGTMLAALRHPRCFVPPGWLAIGSGT